MYCSKRHIFEVLRIDQVIITSKIMYFQYLETVQCIVISHKCFPTSAYIPRISDNISNTLNAKCVRILNLSFAKIKMWHSYKNQKLININANYGHSVNIIFKIRILIYYEMFGTAPAIFHLANPTGVPS